VMATAGRRDAQVKRLVVGISGATGIIYGIRLLETLHAAPGIETHLVLSAAAKRTMVEETSWTVQQVETLATRSYPDRDIGAAIASGSFSTCGMVIAPCSMKTLAAVATGYTESLLARAADVTLKEGRCLIALVRETPLHRGHLEAMLALAQAGGIVWPPLPDFSRRPRSVAAVIDETVGHVLRRLGFSDDVPPQWEEVKARTGRNAGQGAETAPAGARQRPASEASTGARLAIATAAPGAGGQRSGPP